MTPLPGPLGGNELVAWRLDEARFAAAWDSGEGAFRAGGRWNRRGTRAVYCTIDPATAILEVAVHAGLATLDTVAYVLTSIVITAPARVHVVDAASVPNPSWLRPCAVSWGQQAFGDALLAQHGVVALPSVVSTHSWILVCAASGAGGSYELRSQERFALDTRLHPVGC